MTAPAAAPPCCRRSRGSLPGRAIAGLLAIGDPAATFTVDLRPDRPGQRAAHRDADRALLPRLDLDLHRSPSTATATRLRSASPRALLATASVAVALAAADTYVVVLALTDMMSGVGLGIDVAAAGDARSSRASSSATSPCCR